MIKLLFLFSMISFPLIGQLNQWEEVNGFEDLFDNIGSSTFFDSYESIIFKNKIITKTTTYSMSQPPSMHLLAFDGRTWEKLPQLPLLNISHVRELTNSSDTSIVFEGKYNGKYSTLSFNGNELHVLSDTTVNSLSFVQTSDALY